jgi:hypothetical protein
MTDTGDIMKPLTLILCSIMNTSVCAWDVEIGTGITHFNEPKNGFWYQKEFDHSLDLYSRSFRLGVVEKVGNKMYFHTGYKYLGKSSSRALASSSDINYENWRAGSEKIWPLSIFSGKGKVDGIYTLFNYRSILDLYGGAWLHRVQWTVTIPDWRPNRYEQRHLKVSQDDSLTSGFVVGVGKKYKSFGISYMVWQIDGKYPFKTMNDGFAHEIEINYEFLDD